MKKQHADSIAPVMRELANKTRIGRVVIFSLGGLNEIGKNMYGIQYGDEIIVIDAGIKFPDNDLPGVDYIIPDFSYLLENRDKVKGIFLTHGHEDHIGGLPYVLQQLRVPVYGAALTIGLVRPKLEEHRLLSDAELHVIDGNSVIRFEKLAVRFFRTAHSIPDAFGIVVQTPQGQIVHTGDFKFDLTPLEQPPELHKMAEIGQRGVLALLADSTNSEKPGFTPSEKMVGNAIKDTFQRCKGRILFATFASNVHRLQQAVEAAVECGRKIAIIGRSMERVFAIGQELGYIRVPKGSMIDIREVNDFRSQEIVIICTGSQGEPQAALTRIAGGSHAHVQICPGDTVIFSSSPIPGNTQNINRSIDRLLRAGAEVMSGSILDIHASGHGCQEDLKLMLNLMKPQYFIPIHGEYRMLFQHRRLAEQLGVLSERIFVMDIGETLIVSRKQAHKGRKIPHGVVLVKGKTVSGLESTVIDDRKQLAKSGVLIVTLVVDRSNHEVLSGPDLVSRGFIYVREAGEVITMAKQVATRVCSSLSKKKIESRNVWKQSIRQALASHFETAMERSPLVMPVIMEV